MTRLCCTAIIFAASTLMLQARIWTDASGRTLEADLIEVDHDYVKIKRSADGQIFSLPIASLSAADQVYLQKISLNDEAGADNKGESNPKPFDGLQWPRRVSLPEDYEVEIVKEDSAAAVYIYRTPNFEFHSDVKLARKVVREFGKIFEGTYEAMQVFPLHWKPQPSEGHFKTRLYESMTDYLDAGGLPNSGGVYVPKVREIWVPLESLGVKKSSSSYTLDDSDEHSTLVHEITHQVHHDWLGKLPPWVIEGMAVYMESVPNDDGEFRFDKRELEEFVQSQTPVESIVLMVSIERLMTLSHADWNANFEYNKDELSQYYLSAFLLLNYFLHFDGEGEGRRLYAYCRAIESGKDMDGAREFLLDGRTYAEITEDLIRAYKREDIDISIY